MCRRDSWWVEEVCNCSDVLPVDKLQAEALVRASLSLQRSNLLFLLSALLPQLRQVLLIHLQEPQSEV